MSTRRFALRLDIDTYTGYSQGLPPLLEMAADQGARMTIFVNMGRMWHPSRLLDRASGGSTGELSLRDKFSGRELLVEVARNRRVGGSDPGLLKTALAAGHEVGLHGGRNHGVWHANVSRWSRGRIAREIQWGLDQMEDAGLPRPASFASPGFTRSEVTESVLAGLGFSLVADVHEGDAAQLTTVMGPLCQLTTSRLGTGHGVGFIAHHHARGSSPKEVGSHIRRVAGEQETAVIYDHPIVAGRLNPNLTRACLAAGVAAGVEWVTMSELAHDLTTDSRSPG